MSSDFFRFVFFLYVLWFYFPSFDITSEDKGHNAISRFLHDAVLDCLDLWMVTPICQVILCRLANLQAHILKDLWFEVKERDLGFELH